MNAAQQEDRHLSAGDKAIRAVIERAGTAPAGDACRVNRFDVSPAKSVGRDIGKCGRVGDADLFIRADIAGYMLRTRHAALIGGGTTDVRACVNRGRGYQQNQRLGGTAVVRQRTEFRIAAKGWGTGVIFH